LNECVFNSKNKCPVRKAMNKTLKTHEKISKIIKPMGDKETLEIFMPIIQTMQEAFHNEYSNLHYYCQICPMKYPAPQKS
jgi:phosphoribosyl-ATP pyrophosphohydrolase